MSFQTKHKWFIETSIITEMEAAVHAVSTLPAGMDSYPLCDYLIQSLMLRLTGFQEQKLRCICWDIATFNYNYRHRLLNNEDKLGEYSNITAKSAIYTTLVRLIAELDEEKSHTVDFYINKKEIVVSCKGEVIELFDKSLFSQWLYRDYCSIKSDNCLFKPEHFANKGLLESCLRVVYDELYQQRNRLAHNAYSYQENLPSLRTLCNQDSQHHNYFTWFVLLNLIDKIFTDLYFVYFKFLSNNQY